VILDAGADVGLLLPHPYEVPAFKERVAGRAAIVTTAIFSAGQGLSPRGQVVLGLVDVGWRWVVIPFAVGMLYLGYVLSCTWPNFLAIHGQASTPVFWLAAIASSVMNGGVGAAALYTPAAKHHREAARARVGMDCAETDSADVAQSV
jgi:Na+/glutamate symporter